LNSYKLHLWLVLTNSVQELHIEFRFCNYGIFSYKISISLIPIGSDIQDSYTIYLARQKTFTVS